MKTMACSTDISWQAHSDKSPKSYTSCNICNWLSLKQNAWDCVKHSWVCTWSVWNIRERTAQICLYRGKSVTSWVSPQWTWCFLYTRKIVLSCQFFCVFSTSKIHLSPFFLKLTKKYQSPTADQIRQSSLSVNSSKCLVHVLDARKGSRLHGLGSFFLILNKDWLRLIFRFREFIYIPSYYN